jgi:hypothetical protein
MPTRKRPVAAAGSGGSGDGSGRPNLRRRWPQKPDIKKFLEVGVGVC